MTYMNKGSIVERLCSDLDRKEPGYKSSTLLYFYRRPIDAPCTSTQARLKALQLRLA